MFIIHNASCRPNEQKRAAVRYLNNRGKQETRSVIETLLQKNGYHTNEMLSYGK
jgi:hypothetical protein